MKKYVSFIGSLLYDQLLSENENEETIKKVNEIKNNICILAREFGQKLTEKGHLVKVGSFSELDYSFAYGAVVGVEKINGNPKESVFQIVGNFTEDNYRHPKAAQIRTYMEDDFFSGRSAFISDAKAIVLLGGHFYAKMLGSWAYNLGIPLFALPQCGFAGAEFWKYLISNVYNNEIFPGIGKEEYQEIGILNADPNWLAEKLYFLIEKSSKNWVKPSILPDEMRYKPNTNQVIPNTAFIAMSFSEQKDKVFESIRKACTLAGLRGFRGDNKSFYQKNLNIMTNVTESIVRSQVIIVDISDRNPNVFYEMGVADTLGKPMILLFDGRGDIPFDVKGLRHLRYNEKNIEEIIEPLKKILEGFKLK